jgi:hypothetical protein
VEGQGWKATVKHRRDGKEAEHSEVWQGQDRFHEWLSRNWYDITGTGDLRHYHAGTNVKVMSAKRQVFITSRNTWGNSRRVCLARFRDDSGEWSTRKIFRKGSGKSFRITESKRLNSCGFSGDTFGRLPIRNTGSSSCRLTAFGDADFWAERIATLLQL